MRWETIPNPVRLKLYLITHISVPWIKKEQEGVGLVTDMDISYIKFPYTKLTKLCKFLFIFVCPTVPRRRNPKDMKAGEICLLAI